MKTGDALGHNQVLDKLGEGGEVYRARDTKLDRDVAFKIHPDELAADEERVPRFEREAKLLASLNHPNIASIYGFEESSQPERSAQLDESRLVRKRRRASALKWWCKRIGKARREAHDDGGSSL